MAIIGIIFINCTHDEDEEDDHDVSEEVERPEVGLRGLHLVEVKVPENDAEQREDRVSHRGVVLRDTQRAGCDRVQWKNSQVRAAS